MPERRRRAVAPVPVVVRVWQPDGGHGPRWSRSLRRDLNASFAALLVELAIPGMPAVRVARPTTADPVLIQVHGRLVEIPSFLTDAMLTALTKSDSEPPATHELAGICRAIVAESASSLLGKPQLDAWLEGHRPRAATRRLLESVLTGLLDLGVAISRQEVVLPRVEAAAAIGMADFEIVEQLYARLRPGVLEVRTPPKAVDDELAAWLGTALDENVYSRTGVRLPALAFIPDPALGQGSVVLKVNNVLGRSLQPADPDETWSTVASELYRLAYRLVGCVDVEYALAQVRQEAPEPVRAVLGRYSPEAVTKVLRELARAGSIVDLNTILDRMARFEVAMVSDDETVVLADRMPVVGTDREGALADWRNQLAYARA